MPPPETINKRGTTGYQRSKDANRVLTGGCESSLASHLDAGHAIRRAKSFKRALFLKRRLFQNIEDFLEAAAPCKVLRGEAPPRLHIAPRAQEQQSFHNRRLVLGDCHMQWVACTLRGAVKQLPWLLKHMPYQNLGSSGRTLLSFCQDAGATPRMLGFVDVHEAVSLQKGLRHHLKFVVPGSRVPSPRTRQAAFLSLRAALACLPTSGLGGGEGLLPVHLRLGRESCSDLALQLRILAASHPKPASVYLYIDSACSFSLHAGICVLNSAHSNNQTNKQRKKTNKRAHTHTQVASA